MLISVATVSPLILWSLTTGAHAVAISKETSPNQGSSLAAISCCALAKNNFYIYDVCSDMHTCSGGVYGCLKTDQRELHWCSYCLLHSEEDVCYQKTWPPNGPAPISKREVDGSDDSLNADTDVALTKREVRYIQTHPFRANVAQNYVSNFGLVVFRIAVNVNGLVTWAVQNAGSYDITAKIYDQASKYTIQKFVGAFGGEEHGQTPSQVLMKPGDKFSLSYVYEMSSAAS